MSDNLTILDKNGSGEEEDIYDRNHRMKMFLDDCMVYTIPVECSISRQQMGSGEEEGIFDRNRRMKMFLDNCMVYTGPIECSISSSDSDTSPVGKLDAFEKPKNNIYAKVSKTTIRKTRSLNCNITKAKYPQTKFKGTDQVDEMYNVEFQTNNIICPECSNRSPTYRKFKRIYSPSPDSDSETVKSKKSKNNYNTFLYEDDIFFQPERKEIYPDLSLCAEDKYMKKLVKHYGKILTNPKEEQDPFDLI